MQREGVIMSRPDVRIVLDGRGGGELLVDGHNIAAAVTAIEVVPGPLGVEVFVRMRPRNLDVTASGAHVAVDDETRVALERLGWTSPQAMAELQDRLRETDLGVVQAMHTTEVPDA
jgi:hypothetical protein